MRTSKSTQKRTRKPIEKRSLAKTMKTKTRKRRGPTTSKLGHFRPKTEVTTTPTQTGYREWINNKQQTFNQQFNTWDNEIVTKTHEATFCGRKINIVVTMKTRNRTTTDIIHQWNGNRWVITRKRTHLTLVTFTVEMEFSIQNEIPVYGRHNSIAIALKTDAYQHPFSSAENPHPAASVFFKRSPKAFGNHKPQIFGEYQEDKSAKWMKQTGAWCRVVTDGETPLEHFLTFLSSDFPLNMRKSNTHMSPVQEAENSYHVYPVPLMPKVRLEDLRERCKGQECSSTCRQEQGKLHSTFSNLTQRPSSEEGTWGYEETPGYGSTGNWDSDSDDLTPYSSEEEENDTCDNNNNNGREENRNEENCDDFSPQYDTEATISNLSDSDDDREQHWKRSSKRSPTAAKRRHTRPE